MWIFITDIIRGKLPIFTTFWFWWFGPQFLLFLISLALTLDYMGANGIAVDQMGAGRVMFLIFLYFLSSLINLTAGVGVFFSFMNDSGGRWGIAAVLFVVGSMWYNVTELANILGFETFAAVTGSVQPSQLR